MGPREGADLQRGRELGNGQPGPTSDASRRVQVGGVSENHFAVSAIWLLAKPQMVLPKFERWWGVRGNARKVTSGHQALVTTHERTSAGANSTRGPLRVLTGSEMKLGFAVVQCLLEQSGLV